MSPPINNNGAFRNWDAVKFRGEFSKLEFSRQTPDAVSATTVLPVTSLDPPAAAFTSTEYSRLGCAVCLPGALLRKDSPARWRAGGVPAGVSVSSRDRPARPVPSPGAREGHRLKAEGWNTHFSSIVRALLGDRGHYSLSL